MGILNNFILRCLCTPHLSYPNRLSRTSMGIQITRISSFQHANCFRDTVPPSIISNLTFRNAYFRNARVQALYSCLNNTHIPGKLLTSIYFNNVKKSIDAKTKALGTQKKVKI